MAHLLGLLFCGLFLVVAVVGQQRPINTCWDSQKVNDELQQCIQRSSGGNVGGSAGGGSSGGGWQPLGGRKPWTGQGNGNPGNGQGGNNGGNVVAGGGLDGSFQPTGPGSINNGGGSSYGGLNGGVQPGSGNSGGGSYSGGLNGGAQPGGSGMSGGWNYNRDRPSRGGQGWQGGSGYSARPSRGQGGSNGQWGGAGGRYMTQRCYMEIYRGTSDANNLDLVKIRDNIGRLASVDKASDLMSAFDTCAQSYSASTNVAKMRDYDQCMRNSMQTICYTNTGSGTGGVGPGINPGAGLNNGVGPAAGP